MGPLERRPLAEDSRRPAREGAWLLWPWAPGHPPTAVTDATIGLCAPGHRRRRRPWAASGAGSSDVVLDRLDPDAALPAARGAGRGRCRRTRRRHSRHRDRRDASQGSGQDGRPARVEGGPARGHRLHDGQAHLGTHAHLLGDPVGLRPDEARLYAEANEAAIHHVRSVAEKKGSTATSRRRPTTSTRSRASRWTRSTLRSRRRRRPGSTCRSWRKARCRSQSQGLCDRRTSPVPRA